jgi:hypothetical protein
MGPRELTVACPTCGKPVVTTPVGAYFKPGSSKAVTTRRVRATPGGTGWINMTTVEQVQRMKDVNAEAAKIIPEISNRVLANPIIEKFAWDILED